MNRLELKKIIREELLKEVNTQSFKMKNTNKKEMAAEWVKLEVFSSSNHSRIAKDLGKILRQSGFLEKYIIFSITINGT